MNFEDNIDEYDSEAGRLIVRLKDIKSKSEIISILKDVFTEMFDKQLASRKLAKDAYPPIAHEIWQLLGDSQNT